jgi:uncharacterized protein YyaL (SSP411 family)
MPNHLINENSPYLLQHVHNPVDWFPWEDEALNKARAENKPIFLSIGYAACHWCHVMAHESFEDAETAAFMNEHFINIKVDREERPDLDAIYMQATVAMTGSGGWPMSVFLTPDLQPFYTGTYFPPVPRHNLPSFKDVLRGIERGWREEQDEITKVGEQVTQHLQQVMASSKSDTSFNLDLHTLVNKIIESYDWGYGGWGSAPKFPQPMTIEFLLRRSALSVVEAQHRPSTTATFFDYAQDEVPLKPALHALKSMARGGMYDVVGGGFSRYSTDNFWRVPHFEKMLYDNAQLALIYLHAWQITKESFYKQIVIETLDFVRREMTHPDGGFYSSLDADSEGNEGKFYVWTLNEIRAALKDDADFFEAAYGITPKGNWDGRTVLQRTLDDASLATRFKLDLETVSTKLTNCYSRLLSVRAARIRPSTDDKILTAWNGLMLHAFAESARVLDDKGKAASYLIVATRSAEFLLTQLRYQGRLCRSWRDGQVTKEVFLEDYAALIISLLELYQTDFNDRWFASARQLADEMLHRFSDPSGGFFDTPDDGERLLICPKDIQDNATPSGNALACEALLKLAAFTGKGKYRDMAEKTLGLVTSFALRYPTGFARWLSAADFAQNNEKQVAVLYEARDEKADALIQIIRSEYRPNIIVAASTIPPSNDAPELLKGRPLVGNSASVYVCEGFVCLQPITNADDLIKQL